jgi:ribonuclease P protein component
MLKKDNRIKSPIIFQKTLSQGEKKDSQYFKIIFFKNNENISRFAVIVSTKVNKLSVKRNFLKRRVKNILRETISVLPKGFDALIFVKKDCFNISFNEMQGQLKELLIKTLRN